MGIVAGLKQNFRKLVQDFAAENLQLKPHFLGIGHAKHGSTSYPDLGILVKYCMQFTLPSRSFPVC
jgi:hypothetical protein